MDDLSCVLNNTPVGCNFNGVMYNHLMYADDTCIIAPSPSALQKLLTICNNFAVDNFILFNEKKTKCMCFKPRNLSDLHVPNLYLNNVNLEFVSGAKYLGVLISDKLNDDDDIFRQVKSLYARGNVLISRFRCCSDDVKLKLFRYFISNSYGCHLWANYKQSSFKRLVVAYNNVFRKLFNIRRGTSMSYIYVCNNIDSIGVLVRKSLYSFMHRIQDSANNLVTSFKSSTFYYTSNFNMHYRRKVFTL